MTAAFNLIDRKSVKVGGSDDVTHGCGARLTNGGKRAANLKETGQECWLH